MITLRADELKRAEVALAHIKDGAAKAAMEALNTSANEAKKKAILKVKETYDVKSTNDGNIKEKGAVNIIRLQKATLQNLNAYVMSSGSRLPLIRFSVRPNSMPKKPTPIIVSVKRSGGTPLKHAFITRVKSSHIGVFERVGLSRLPIKQLHGPSLPQMLGESKVSAYIEEEAQKLLDVNLDKAINRLMEG